MKTYWKIGTKQKANINTDVLWVTDRNTNPKKAERENEDTGRLKAENCVGRSHEQMIG